MDWLVVVVLLVLAAFCWLLAAGERRATDDTVEPADDAPQQVTRFRFSPLRAVAPGLVGLACLVATMQVLSLRGSGAIPLLFVGVAVALAFGWRALATYRECVDYVRGRGLYVTRWSGKRWMPFEAMAHIAYDSARGKPDNHVARVTIRMRDGSELSLHEGLHGFEVLVDRLAAECPEGIVETAARQD